MKHTMFRAGRLLLAICFIAVLVACGTTQPTLQPVNVAVPVPCQETEPERPNMPAEALKARGCPSGHCVDELLQASTAENLRREAYEVKLRTALQACIAPIVQP